jgi:hypothetical protein
MPYKVVKVPKNGFKVKNIETGKTYSKKGLPLATAKKQMRAIYLKTGGK